MPATQSGQWMWIAALSVMVVIGGCSGNPLTGPEGGVAPSRLTKPAIKAVSGSETFVIATITDEGLPIEGVEVAFSSSVSGRSADYLWTGITDVDGVADIEITSQSGGAASRYYLVKATDTRSGQIIGMWHSLPITAFPSQAGRR